MKKQTTLKVYFDDDILYENPKDVLLDIFELAKENITDSFPKNVKIAKECSINGNVTQYEITITYEIKRIKQ